MKQNVLLTLSIVVTVFTIGLAITIPTVRYLEVQRDYQRLKDSLPRLIREYTQLKKDFVELKKEKTFKSLNVEVTSYSPSRAQTDSNPFETASTQIVTPKDLNEWLYVAVSRDLLSKFTRGAPFEYGDPIYLRFTVIDTMHKRWTNTIDVFVRNQKIAKLFGRQQRSIVFIDK